MANFDDFKKKAIEAVEVLADASVDLYKKAETKTKELARTAKLQADNTSDRTSIKKLYMEIGKHYYETHKMFPEPEFEQDCEEITSLMERIAEREAEIASLKNKAGESAEDADFEEDDELPDEDEVECDCGCAEHSKDETDEAE